MSEREFFRCDRGKLTLKNQSPVSVQVDFQSTGVKLDSWLMLQGRADFFYGIHVSYSCAVPVES